LWVNFKDKSYRAGVDLDNEEFKKLLETTGEIPTTSASTPAVFLEEYTKLTKSGLEVVSVHVGKNLSPATHESATIAVKMLPSGRVTILDTETVSMAQGLQVIALEKMAAAGATTEEIVAMHSDLKIRTKLRGVTPNFPFLERSGRASRLQNLFGSLLDIKPILQIDNSKVEPIERMRTMRRTLDWLVNFAREQGEMEQVAIVDFEAGEDADVLRFRLKDELKIPEEIIYRGGLGPLTGTHGGPRTFALVTMRKG
jgi:DegV family protein with EDD domain